MAVPNPGSPSCSAVFPSSADVGPGGFACAPPARVTPRLPAQTPRPHAAATRESVEHAHTVAMGADDGVAMVMRFIRPTIRIHVGQQVSFTNTGMAAPHTVTFGVEPANFFAPSGDPTNFSGGDLNSGIVGPGGSFTVTFKKAGTFGYSRALHDYMGMMGKVIVVGRYKDSD